MADSIPELWPTIAQFADVLSAESKWYDLGVFLAIPTSKLDIIEKNHHTDGVQRCLIELYKCFESRPRPVSWVDIADALKKMRNKQLCKHIRRNYVHPALCMFPPTPPYSEEQEDTTDSDSSNESAIQDDEYLFVNKAISNDFNKIVNGFTSLLLETKRALQRKPVSLDDLQAFLKEEYNLEPFREEEVTLQKIFTRMRQYYCFLSYDILLRLVDRFFSDDKPLRQVFDEYTQKLESFKQSAKMKELMRLITEKRVILGKYRILKLKLLEYWGQVTMKKFEKVVNAVFNDLYHRAAQIRVDEGCICVSWVIPDIDTSTVVSMIDESRCFLRAIGVISLTIDNEVLYEGPNAGCNILESAFLQALELRNIDAVELFMEVGCDPNLQTYTKETAITTAAKISDSEGKTAIYLASSRGHTNAVQSLLASSTLEGTTIDGVTPLMAASKSGYNDVVELLLKSKANPNARSKDGATAIYFASENGHSVVVSTLLKSGADPNTCSKDGITPIYIASRNGQFVTVSTLLKSGADPNVRRASNGLSPLMIACGKGHIEVVKQLIEHSGIDINCRAVAGITAFHLASRYGHIDIIKILLESGCVDTNHSTSDVAKITTEVRQSPFENSKSTSQLSLDSTDTSDTGYYEGEADDSSVTTYLSSYSDIDDDLMSPNDSVTLKYIERVPEIAVTNKQVT